MCLLQDVLFLWKNKIFQYIKSIVYIILSINLSKGVRSYTKQSITKVNSFRPFFGPLSDLYTGTHEKTINIILLFYSFYNNQPGAIIIQIYSVINLYSFGHLLCPSSGVLHCTFGTGKFHAGFDDRSQAQLGWNILTLLGNGHQNLHETYQCRMDSRELLMWAEKMPETCRVL